MHAGRVVAVGSLIDAVWGEDPPETATNTLQVHVSALRKALTSTDTQIERIDGGYRLGLSPSSVDAHRFEAAIAEGRAALRGGRHDRACELLSGAIATWRGRPFDGLDSVPFVESARPAFENGLDAASVELAECLVELGRYDDAIDEAERLISRSPYDERGWAAAMVGYYWAGRQSDSLQCFQRARRVLGEELGLEPGPALVILEQAVLAQDLAPPTRATGASDTRPSTPVTVASSLPAERPLVGRAAIVDRVAGWLGSGDRLISLVGLGGIGKTSVASAVAHRIETNGGEVWFVDLSAATEIGTAADTIARMVGAGVDADPIDGLIEWAADAKGVIVLDNLEQIVEAPSLVRSLLDGGRSIQLLTTSRKALRLRDERLVALPPLPVRNADGVGDDATQLFRLRAEYVRSDLEAIDDEIVIEICELTAGIPLGVELAALQLRELSPSQLLRRLRGFRSAALDASGTADYPERHQSLRVILDSTTGLLVDDALTTLAHASLAGGPITVDLVIASCLDAGIEALAHLADLVESGLIRRVDDRLAVPPPIRQYVDEIIPPGDFAAARDHVFAQVDKLIAEADQHWFSSEADRLRERLVADAAAIDAMIAGRLEHGRFVQLAEQALKLGQYWLHESRLADALSTLDTLRSADLAVELAARIQLLTGTFASYVNRSDTIELLDPALRSSTGVPDRLVVNAWCCLGAFHAHRHEDDDLRECADRAAEAAAATRDPALVSLARDFAGYAAHYLGDAETAVRLNLEAIEDARRQGDRHALALLLATTAEAMIGVGRFEEAGALVTEAFDLARDVDLGIALTLVLIMLGATQIELGRPATAWGSLVEHLRFTRSRYPDPLAVGDSLAQLAAAKAAMGDDEAAARIWGASAAIHADHAVDPDRRRPHANQRRLDASRERLGSERFEACRLAGSADPDRTIDSILGDAEPSASG